MLARNGRQLASKFPNGASAVEKRFFDVFFRWSRVGCVAAGSRRSSTQTLSPAEAHSQKFRHIMRLMPHPIVVLTTMASKTPGVVDWSKPGDSKEEIDPSLYRGMTLSSFTSLSMGPEPLITFNIGFPSRTLSALTETRHFLIHVLKANTGGSYVADAFTKGNAVHAIPGSEDGKETVVNTAFHEAGSQEHMTVRVHEMEHSGKRGVRLPLLDCRSAVTAVLESQVLGEGDRAGGGLIRIGDHVLVVAKVTGVVAGVGGYTDTTKFISVDSKSTRGLCYRDGKYAKARKLIRAAGSSWQGGENQESEDATEELDD
ncbi:flavin reductase like domain-containing protein [Leptodontidium sp. MPI-SDFR-AT-0119]|nr:flavin reductase like domain-containing protein [Leptodontidium sp. MPI-SDFR-AT-0119]